MRVRFTEALASLSAAQKPSRGVSYYSRLVNRPLGRVFAAGAAVLGLSPNAVTVVSAVLTVAATVVLATQKPSLLVGVAVCALLVLGFALDAADGQLARLLRRASKAGEWFDHVVDSGKAVIIHAAVLVAAYRFLPIPLWWLIIPLAFQLVSIVVQSGGTLRGLLGGARTSLVSEDAAGPIERLSPVVLLVGDSGVFGLLFLTYPWPHVFVVAYPALLVANVILGVALLAKWGRELSAAHS